MVIMRPRIAHILSIKILIATPKFVRYSIPAA